jgi:DNA/RNA-binding domain of Phe-tRNA-synthetase-like protein
MEAVPLDVAIDADLAGRVRLGILTLHGVAVQDADAALAAEVEAYCSDLKARYGGGTSSEVPGAGDARALYKALGLDPTKTRPSNEALLRRALKGEGLFRINTLVDAMNLCSLRYQLPFGLYDLDQIRAPVRLRRGAAGEAYEGIRKGAVNVEGRPVLVDALGPFGNPTSDSARTMITKTSRNALVTVYAPAAYSPARLTAALDGTRDTLHRFCGGTPAEKRILPPG